MIPIYCDGPYVQLNTGIFATQSLTYSSQNDKGPPTNYYYETKDKAQVTFVFTQLRNPKVDHCGFCYYCPTQTKCTI